MMHQLRHALLLLLALAGAAGAATAPADPRPRQDRDGNPLRYAATGHVSNYDETKAGAYTLPDPLVFQDGRAVRDAADWARRRAEICALYEKEVHGRVPATAPAARFEVVATDAAALDGLAIRRHIVGHFGTGPDGPRVNVVLYLPRPRATPAPLLVQMLFGPPPGLTQAISPPKDTKVSPPRNPPREHAPLTDIVGRGYAYALLRYTEIEGDRAETNLTGVRRLALREGQEKPAGDEWGTIAAWSWGVSRITDFLLTDPALDPRRLAVIGHSRLGKTALWIGATDERFRVVFSSCSGEMGAALSRRDYGETIDDMAANFPWQFAGNFQKYPGRWGAMPVDSHLLIALSAPRAVFVTGGTQDQWADPRGQFLALAAAGPVWRLLGAADLGVREMPGLDKPLTSGDLGFLYHTGGHTITAGDWQAFLDFTAGAFGKATADEPRGRTP